MPRIAAPVTLRSFAAGDARAMAEAWTEGAPQDGMTERRLRDLVLLDRNFDPDGLFVAQQGDRVVGSAYAVRRRVAHHGDDLQAGTGWIPYFFVVPSARGTGLGRRLVEAAMAWLRAQGAREVLFSSYTPNYVLPGLDAARYPAAERLLHALGFAEVERPSAMDLSLIGYQMPEEVRARVAALRGEGWHLGTPTNDDLVPLIRIAGESFSSDWARAIREGVLGGMPLERILIARDPAGDVLGWAMHGTYEAVIERFGPFGVLPASRGTGLGKVLLHLTLERMTALGAHSAWFLWADEGSAASKLYERTGFRITRTFSILRAPLD
ncbi:GNAT family N-acetyltransferase [Georgenia sp. SYP-B2076]|uniref:GNAT family N-acetyltransferase n=1 Tax=Georgenia sp. SYP-B2076 TaxID=2495881 RepID=UPI00197AD5E9|nr:GNAT family N-acetyltransferase [Georgenia sp. SYP-B2076]